MLEEFGGALLDDEETETPEGSLARSLGAHRGGDGAVRGSSPLPARRRNAGVARYQVCELLPQAQQRSSDSALSGRHPGARRQVHRAGRRVVGWRRVQGHRQGCQTRHGGVVPERHRRVAHVRWRIEALLPAQRKGYSTPGRAAAPTSAIAAPAAPAPAPAPKNQDALMSMMAQVLQEIRNARVAPAPPRRPTARSSR